MAVEYEISSDVATITGVASNTQVASIVKFYTGSITYDDEPTSKYASVTINGRTQRVMLCVAVSGTVNYDDVPCLYSTVSGHRTLNVVEPTESGTPDDVPSLYETVVVNGKTVRALRCVLISATPNYDGISSTCTFIDNGKTHTAQLVNQVSSGSIETIVKGVSPLSLPDAIANSLSYVKAFGGTEQRNLPDNYIERQFIYMMDGSYLLTDIVPTYDCKVEMDFQTTSVPSGSVYLLGGRTETYGGLFFAKGGGGVCLVDAFGTSSDDRYTSNVSLSSNTRYKFTFDNKVATFESGGTTLFTNTFTGENANSAALVINGLNSNGTVSGAQTGIYLYSFKVWNAQGELVADYVPAVQRGTVPVVGFYDTVSKTFKTATAGTFAAGGEAVPTPDTPMDIVSNNGVVKAFKTLNISTYDTSPNDAGIDITFDGATDRRKRNTLNDSGTGTNHYENGFVSIYMGQNGNNYYVKALVNGVAYNGSVYNTGEQIDSWGFTAIKNIDIYCPAINTDGTVETINVHGKNLFDENVVLGGTMSSRDGTDGVPNPARARLEYLYLPAGTYTISNNGNTINQVVGVSYSDDAGSDYSPIAVWEWHNLPFAFTLTSNRYVRFMVRNSSNVELTTGNIGKFQLEKGSTATTYEPYFDGGTATAEMLLKVGDYQDVQSILDGAITRNIGIKVLDGTESWNASSTYPGSCYISNFLIPAAEQFPLFYCSHFEIARSTASYARGKCLITGNAAGWRELDVWYSNNGATAVADLKSWLAAQYAAGTPVIVLYPLATPTTESVTGQTLQVTDGDNVLEITQASLNNLELEAKYEKSA